MVVQKYSCLFAELMVLHTIMNVWQRVVRRLELHVMDHVRAPLKLLVKGNQYWWGMAFVMMKTMMTLVIMMVETAVSLSWSLHFVRIANA